MRRAGLIGLMLLTSLTGWTQDVNAIIERSESNLRGASSEGTIEINIVRPTWERNITATTWSEGSDYSMVLINSPARDRGTVFLKREQEMWNYIPTINRQVKMPPSMMSQSWMGSDFNNDDLVRESSLVRDYTHTLVGREVIRGEECYVIESVPNDDAPVVWGKLTMHITVGHELQWQTDFYDEYGDLVQRMEGYDIAEFDGRKLPSRIRMTPMDVQGEYTEMIYQSLDFDVQFAANFFSTQNMKRVR